MPKPYLVEVQKLCTSGDARKVKAADSFPWEAKGYLVALQSFDRRREFGGQKYDPTLYNQGGVQRKYHSHGWRGFHLHRQRNQLESLPIPAVGHSGSVAIPLHRKEPLPK